MKSQRKTLVSQLRDRVSGDGCHGDKMESHYAVLCHSVLHRLRKTTLSRPCLAIRSPAKKWADSLFQFCKRTFNGVRMSEIRSPTSDNLIPGWCSCKAILSRREFFLQNPSSKAFFQLIATISKFVSVLTLDSPVEMEDSAACGYLSSNDALQDWIVKGPDLTRVSKCFVYHLLEVGGRGTAMLWAC